MKTFKFFLASLFLMLCSVASAQQVVVTKTDGTVETFQPNEVDSVVYKPATKYYYYAGWECPMNEEDLARLAVAPNGACIGTSLGTYTNDNPLYAWDGNKGTDLTNTTITNGTTSYKQLYYFVCPSTCNIYDITFGSKVNDGILLEKVEDIGVHTVWKSTDPSKYIDGYKIY